MRMRNVSYHLTSFYRLLYRTFSMKIHFENINDIDLNVVDFHDLKWLNFARLSLYHYLCTIINTVNMCTVYVHTVLQ